MVRNLIINPYSVPGAGEATEVDITLELVDAGGVAAQGWRPDGMGIAGAYKVLLTDRAVVVGLTPTEEITPPGRYWLLKAEWYSDGKRRMYNSGLIQLASAGGDLTLPEFLALNEAPGWWDVYENRLLPDPAGGAIGSMVSLQEVAGKKAWVVSDAPAGFGTVTSVAVVGVGGITVAGSPITSAGTIIIGVSGAAMGLGTAAYTASTDYDAAGAGAAAVSAHVAASDPHPTYTTAAEAAAAAPVQSVAGRVGAVTLSAGDVTGLAAVATSGAYADLLGRPTLGTASALSHGVGPGDLVRLDPVTGKLPAVDGSLLVNLPGGDDSTIRGVAVAPGAPADGQVLVYRAASAAYVLEDKGGSASAVSLTPVGGVAATNVQAAIQELDAEKAPVTQGAYVSPPTTPTSPGIQGQRAWEAPYLYECVAANTWVRVIPARVW